MTAITKTRRNSMVTCHVIMSYLWSVICLVFASTVALLFLFTSLIRGKRKRGRTSGSALHQVLQQDKVFPISSDTGWTLEGIQHGIRLWKHNFVILSVDHFIYGCNTVVQATTQEILNTLKDVKQMKEWNPYIEHSENVLSPCSSNGGLELSDIQGQTSQHQLQQMQHIMMFDTICVVPKYNAKYQWRKMIVKLSNCIPGVKVIEHENLSINVMRCWQLEHDESIWMFSECPSTVLSNISWTYVQARPLQDSPGSLLTIIVCPEIIDNHTAQMAVTQLATLRDYFMMQKVKVQPPQQENIGNKLKAFAGSLRKKAQTFSFKKDQIDVSDLQAAHVESKATNVESKQEQTQDTGKKPDEPKKFGRKISFDFYKSMTKERAANKAAEILLETDSGESSLVQTIEEENSQDSEHEINKSQEKETKIVEKEEPKKESTGNKFREFAERFKNRRSSMEKAESTNIRTVRSNSDCTASDTQSIKAAQLRKTQSLDEPLSRDTSSTLSPAVEVKYYRTLANQSAAEVLAEALKAAAIDVSSSEADQRRQTGGWQFQGLEKEVVILRKHADSTPYHCFLGKGLIKASPKAVYEAVKNPLTRFTYDNMLKKLDVVSNLGTGLQILHMVHETTQLFRKDSRDFFVLQTSRIDGDLYIVALTSVDCEDYQTQEGCFRSSIQPSGWVIEPAFRNRKVQSMVTYMVQIDIGGKDVPTSFFNFLSKRIPLSIAYLRQYLQSGLP
ncbi:uncharacterized protein LOC102809355 [Saccoglossus kowalevskii]|uniref:Uncharacterized protein LOC102809355 n=1 Tax=Saccoglossus kowalevskii TaxID=10224 RepID=A0ABM0LWS7_SACKO|nr:PREDICTED: uncharacterized protein LOC102809355 [Saccoglossus kowalevskii]